MTLQPEPKRLTAIAIAATVLAAMATISVLAAISSSRNIQNRGTVKAVNIGVYWDSGYTNATSTINWGILPPGSSTSIVLYVRNEGSTPVKLSLTTQNWNPPTASNYMTLTWDKQGQTLNAGSAASASLTLTVFSNTTGITNFSFDIIIAGAEQ